MTNDNKALVPVQDEAKAMSVGEVTDHIKLIHDIMKAAMKEGEHYGTIPGCGDKPTLLKAGAEKLMLTFRMNPDYDVDVIQLPREHREYRIKCKLTNNAGAFIGAGLGSCSTMEGKYRYRNSVELTDTPVPKEYWDMRKSNPKGAQELIGGPGFGTKKTDSGQWLITKKGERVEHDNPADYYNTCLKMAKKRALVDATLTRTAASDIFTQDVEDTTGDKSVADHGEAHQTAQGTAKAQAPPQQAKAQAPSGGIEKLRTVLFPELGSWPPKNEKGYDIRPVTDYSGKLEWAAKSIDGKKQTALKAKAAEIGFALDDHRHSLFKVIYKVFGVDGPVSTSQMNAGQAALLFDCMNHANVLMKERNALPPWTRPPAQAQTQSAPAPTGARVVNTRIPQDPDDYANAVEAQGDDVDLDPDLDLEEDEDFFKT